VLRTRVWTALIALPVVLAIVLFASAPAFSAFIGVLAGWGLYEVAAMIAANAIEAVVLVAAGGIPAIALLCGVQGHWLVPTLVIVAMTVLVAQVARDGAESVERGWPFLLLGALWVGVLFPYFALLRNSSDGVATVIFVLLLVIASDSGAYFAGRWRGKRKLLPRVSPAKTVEGAVGGLAACIVAGVILRTPLAAQWSWHSVVVLSGGVGVLAQLGDLTGSAFKRVAGVKDSGWILPGHGGLLDRTCSLVFPAVFTYYYGR
jgi:phosphatidate cytidylyltransferase